MTKLILENATLWTETITKKNMFLEVLDGKLSKISDNPIASDGHKIEDLQGQVVMPVGVDPQVHMRVPGQAQKETAATALRACIEGGIGAILTMPNTKPVIDTPEVVELCRREVAIAQEKVPVDVKISAAISMGQKGKETVDFKRLVKAGVVAFTDDGVGVVSDDIMKSAFAASAEYGTPILQHAEYPGHGNVLAPGPVQEKLKLGVYSDSVEYEMVARDLKLVKDFPEARYHVLHVSSRKTVELVEEAKNQGLNVTCEVSPHHLFFNSSDISLENSSYKMNPPLREREHQLALQEALASGVIDFVATDHAPHESDSKTTNFKTAAFGTTGLETSLRVLLDLVLSGKLSEQRFVEVFSTKPAAFLGIQSDFGSLDVGKYFNAAVISSPTEKHAITTNELYSLSKNNCFIGHKLPGRISRIFLKNEIFAMEQSV